MPPIVQLGIGLLIAAAIIVRKVLPRPVRKDAPVIANVILLGYGTFITVMGARSAGISVATVVLLVAALGLAVGVGVLLALTIRVSIRDDGTAWRRGTILTVGVWILGLAAHIGLDLAIDATTQRGGLGLLTIYLYLCLALISQNVVLRSRARAVSPGRLDEGLQGPTTVVSTRQAGATSRGTPHTHPLPSRNGPAGIEREMH